MPDSVFRFEIYVDRGKYHWRLLENGVVVMKSREGQSRLEDVAYEIARIRTEVPKATVTGP